MTVTTTVEAPAHLVELRKQLEKLIASAAGLAIAEERVDKAAEEIKNGELWMKGSPMLGAICGAMEYAVGFDGAQTGLDIAQGAQDALDVLDLAINRCDDAS